MKVLVTGGAGFIGSHVVDKLRDAGHEPVVFDLHPSPHHDLGEVETRVGDLLSVEDLREAMAGCDAVCHLAASADVGIVAKEPVEAEQLNSRGTLNVLEAARQSAIKRVIYASTIWIYSDGCDGLVDEETTVGLPSHLYTATKLAGEMYCKSYSELYDVEFTILRFGIPYGPRARPAAVIPAFVKKALAGEPLTIAGAGTQSRRFVYVEDLADGVVRGLDPVASNRVYNLVSDDDVTVRQIADTVGDLVGDVEIAHTEARTADFGGVEVCGARAAHELGWTASTPFQEGVRRYVDWYRASEAAAPAPQEVAVAPAAPSRPDLPRLGWRVAPAGMLLGIVAALTAYLLAVGSIGLDNDEVRTVGLVAFASLGVYGVLAVHWPGARHRRPTGVRLSWALAVAFVLVLVLPWPRHLLHLETEPSTLLLGFVGAGFGVGLAAAGMRYWRDARAAAPEEA